MRGWFSVLAAPCFMVMAMDGSCADAVRGETSQEWSPEREKIVSMEQYLAPMPRGAAPLDEYVRYYFGAVEGGNHMLYGMFILPVLLSEDDQRNGDSIRIVPASEVPQIMDGGCSIVLLKIDADKNVVLNWRCDGGA